MKRRIISTLLAGVLTLGLLPAASAASQPTVEEMAQILAALDIMTGDQYGDLMLERVVTRAEFTKLVIAASPLGKNVGATTTVSPYPDVPADFWAAPYVEAAVTAGYVNGYLDGTFRPAEPITLAMGVSMAVRLLGYADSDFSGAWPAGQMALYHNQDLDRGITKRQDDHMTRQDAMCLFYNLFTARTRTGQPYLTTLGYPLTPAGEIDRVGVINAAMDGPVVLAGDWQSKINFNVDTASVFRGGKPSSLSALQHNDIVYYSKSMRTLWAYSNKVTGLYQAATPSVSSPSAVTVAGKTYPIETPGAAYDLSNLGSHKTGETVTLLLGRDGGVAAVAEGAQGTGTLVGVVSSVSDAPYTDPNGNSYTAKTIRVTATDGGVYSYPVDAKSSFKAGSLVQVTRTGSGDAKVERLGGSTPVSGKVSADAAKLGTIAFSPEVEMLDVNENGLAVKLYPARLAGVELKSQNVKYCRRNASGKIDILILNDATGDLYSYGVMTSVSEVKMPLTLMGSYTYNVAGTDYSCALSGSIFGVAKGPVKLEGSLYSPSKVSALTSVRLNNLDPTTAVSDKNTSYPVWDQVAVYELEKDSYHLSSLDRVRSGYTLIGYYDQHAADSMIRVVVARPK